MSVEACVAVAVRDSGLVAEAEGKVTEWQSRLAQVRAVYYPRLSGVGYLAPMFRVRGEPQAPDVTRDLADWGPYLHFAGTLAQPLYSFGRAAAGERAAAERVQVERARRDQTRNAVALEVRRFYALHLYALGLLPVLESGARAVLDAEKRARELFDEASGKVTQVDLARLRYGAAEIGRSQVQAEVGAALALAALKHAMGLSADAPLALYDERLPDPPEGQPSLAELLRTASERRPEVAQLRHGKEAVLSLEQAERLAAAPAFFLGAQLGADWTPMRPDAANPFAYDPYNQITGGVALGMIFDVDLAGAFARAEAARAQGEQLAGLEKFAQTGIPLEVRKAYEELIQATRMLAHAEESVTAARKWMAFAGAAYTTGTGEAKDLLEGLVAHLQAQRGYQDALLGIHLARAQIKYAVGEAQ